MNARKGQHRGRWVELASARLDGDRNGHVRSGRVADGGRQALQEDRDVVQFKVGSTARHDENVARQLDNHLRQPMRQNTPLPQTPLCIISYLAITLRCRPSTDAYLGASKERNEVKVRQSRQLDER